MAKWLFSLDPICSCQRSTYIPIMWLLKILVEIPIKKIGYQLDMRPGKPSPRFHCSKRQVHLCIVVYPWCSRSVSVSTGQFLPNIVTKDSAACRVTRYGRHQAPTARSRSLLVVTVTNKWKPRRDPVTDCVTHRASRDVTLRRATFTPTRNEARVMTDGNYLLVFRDFRLLFSCWVLYPAIF